MKYLLKIAFLVVFAGSAVAQLQVPGTLDLTFGRRGVLQEIPPAGTTYTIQTVLNQPDGKIVAVVTADIENTPRRFALIRYHRNGSRDATFGNEGIFAPPFASNFLPWSAALQPDGKILVAGVILVGSVSGDAIVVRCMPNGSLDPSFGKGGIVTTDTSTKEVLAYERTTNVFAQSDGKVVLLGYQSRQTRTTPSQYLAGSVFAFRYMPDGSLDPSFGSGGISLVPMEFEDVLVLSAMQAVDGRVVLTSRERSHITAEHRNWVITLNADGSLRNQYPQDLSSIYQILGISDTGYVLFSELSGNKPKLFTLSADGYLANIFYAGTPLTINGYEFWPGTLIRRNNLRFISVGTAYTPSGSLRALVRFDMNGFVDRSYGVNGIGTGPLLSSRTFVTPVMQPDGGIIDIANLAPELGFKLVKYWGDPQ